MVSHTCRQQAPTLLHIHPPHFPSEGSALHHTPPHSHTYPPPQMSALADLLLELPELRCLRLADNDITDISFDILARVSQSLAAYYRVCLLIMKLHGCPFPPSLLSLSQVLIQPELSGLCELDLGSNSLSAGSLLKIREMLMVGRGGGTADGEEGRRELLTGRKGGGNC